MRLYLADTSQQLTIDAANHLVENVSAFFCADLQFVEIDISLDEDVIDNILEVEHVQILGSEIPNVLVSLAGGEKGEVFFFKIALGDGGVFGAFRVEVVSFAKLKQSQ